MSDRIGRSPVQAGDHRRQFDSIAPVDPMHSALIDAELGPEDTEATLRREAPDLLRYLQRQVRNNADAADLLSEVFLVAWRRSSDMPSSARQARMWLFGVARRTAATHRRGTIRRSQLVDRLRSELTANADKSTDPRIEAVQAAMQQLRPADREILAIVLWDGFTPTEAAVILGIRPGTARTRYQRARERITRELHAHGHGPG